MSGLRFSIESLRLSLSGFAPDTARQALEGLDRELELRLRRRRMGPPSPPPDARPGSERQGNSGAALAPVNSRVPLDAAALRGLIADKLLEAMEMPGAWARAQGAGDAEQEEGT